MHKLPIQSIRRKDVCNQYNARSVAASGSAEASRLAFCPPIILTVYRYKVNAAKVPNKIINIVYEKVKTSQTPFISHGLLIKLNDMPPHKRISYLSRF